jgi:hypothetical protein
VAHNAHLLLLFKASTIMPMNVKIAELIHAHQCRPNDLIHCPISPTATVYRFWGESRYLLPLFEKLDPKEQEVLRVHCEYLDRHAADGSLAENASIVESKMVSPHVRSRVEQADQLMRIGIPAGDVWPFVAVTVEAGEREIFGYRLPSVLTRNDVIYLEWEAVIRVRYSAILAAVLGPAPNLLDQRRLH